MYIFKEGLVRFATQKYTNAANSVNKQYIHLTNYSVNKKNEEYVKSKGVASKGEEDQELASKWNLAQLKRFFDKQGINYDTVMFRIRDVIIKSLISIEPHVYNLSARHTKHKNIFFELFGFDILLDSKLKPWLLEVNISPSLSSSSPLDKKIKTVLLCDTLNLAGLHPYDRKAYDRELEQSNKKRLLQGSAVKDPDEKSLIELV